MINMADGCYGAVCSDGYPDRGPHTWDAGDISWGRTSTCPKGWGKAKHFYPTATYTVSRAQGNVNDGTGPIYSTVTKYRDTVYNYTAGRIAKA